MSYISLEAITAPSGIAPLVICLAALMMSGVTPKYSAPLQVPKRPKAVITSSKISRILCCVQISRRRCR
ncbi:hypothetical protein D3C71_2197120 [compost metagenome]